MPIRGCELPRGGGGIPGSWHRTTICREPVLSLRKDLAAGKLPELLDADMLVILTSVDKVCLNYGKEDE